MAYLARTPSASPRRTVGMAVRRGPSVVYQGRRLKTRLAKLNFPEVLLLSCKRARTVGEGVSTELSATAARPRGRRST